MHTPWILMLAACAAPSPAPPPPDVPATVDLSPPWSVVPGGDGEVALRFEDSPHGVRVSLGSTARLPGPGVALVVDGRTVGDPLIAVPTAIGHATRVSIGSEGYDLLVRFASQSLSSLSTDPEAPDDPALTWIRIRPRNGSWRIVLDGLGEVELPATEVGYGSEAQVQLTGPEGRFELTTNAPATTTRSGDGTWTMDTAPSLHERVPYPRTGITWTPLSTDD